MLSHILILFSARSATAEKTPKKNQKIKRMLSLRYRFFSVSQRARNFF
jgi:hypothetical protein